MDAKLAGGADRARALSLFAAVVEQGSFSAAGRVLDLSPSAVSRAIDRIEARLGVRLLLRSTRAITLTAEGQAYLQTARRILADLDDAEQQIADQGAPRGRLRVSAALSHGRLCVVPLLGEFASLYPHILVDIALTDTLVDVAGGQADVAIRFGPLADSSLTMRKLGTTGRVIVASPDYLARHGTPQVPEDLHDHNCLNFNFRRAEPVWPFRRGGQDIALTVKGSIEANNGETLGQLAAAGWVSPGSVRSAWRASLPAANWCRCWRRIIPAISSRSMRCSQAAPTRRRGCGCSWISWSTICADDPSYRTARPALGTREAGSGILRANALMRSSPKKSSISGSAMCSMVASLAVRGMTKAAAMKPQDLKLEIAQFARKQAERAAA
jgi:DNA-binding transcriptional LysR family regulator